MTGDPRADGFHHQALLYATATEFVASAVPVIEGALAADEPVLVVTDSVKLDLLRDHLGSVSSGVAWKDMRGIGGNPARIIPIWRRFVATHASRGRLWGIGEPVWPGRTPEELEEAQEHERLLNVAFAGGPPFTLLCPYDTANLAPAVVRDIVRSHPFAPGDTSPQQGLGDAPFPAPVGAPLGIDLDGDVSGSIRAFLAEHAPAVTDARAADLGVSVVAVAVHMGRPDARARFRLWVEPGGVVAEITGLVVPDDVLVGREWPPAREGAARGLWLANQLCDLVRLRVTPAGGAVRLHLHIPGSGEPA